MFTLQGEIEKMSKKERERRTENLKLGKAGGKETTRTRSEVQEH